MDELKMSGDREFISVGNACDRLISAGFITFTNDVEIQARKPGKVGILKISHDDLVDGRGVNKLIGEE